MSKKAKRFRKITSPRQRFVRGAEDVVRQYDGSLPLDDLKNGPFYLVEEDDDDVARPRDRDAATAIVGASFDAAMDPDLRRKLRHSQALAVVIRVPEPEWVEPTANYLGSTFGPRWQIERDQGSSLSQKAMGSNRVARALSEGLCVAGVTSDPSRLPAPLTSTADITIRIAPAVGPVLRTAIRRFAGQTISEDDAALGIGLSLNELVACFRPGTGAQRITERIAAASKTKRSAVADERLPELEHATEFGPARDFGLRLARDISALRRNELQWDQLPRGLILTSEPGGGKNFYCKSLARACDLPFFHTSVASWFEGSGYLHDVIQRMHAAFDLALAASPSLLYWDEVSSLPRRDTIDSRGQDFWFPVIDAALIRLDGVLSSENRRNVIVVASTNDITRVDPALARPGRLERIVHIPRPDAAGLERILRFHLQGELEGEDLADIAAIAQGATAADIMLLVRDARQAARHADDALSVDHLRARLLPPAAQTPEKLWRACVHEAAHAVMAVVLGFGKIDVVVGSSFGEPNRTLIQGMNDTMPTRETFKNKAMIYLAARAAEIWLPGGISAGSGGGESSDLARASYELAAMNLSAGLGDTLVYVVPPDRALEQLRFDADLRKIVDAQLQVIQERAAHLIEKHRDAVLAVALALSKARHLDDRAVRRICAGRHAMRRPAKPKGGAS
ncbi:AAA family ATPase [Bradyrhizobium yuanmingense]|uniref:AAA family ATPase n=1 Tax=Bradyrhizobium yuanmingense TaxID=108015 RepID=UPI003518BEFC